MAAPAWAWGCGRGAETGERHGALPFGMSLLLLLSVGSWRWVESGRRYEVGKGEAVGGVGMRAVEADRGVEVEEEVVEGATGLGKGGIEGSTVGLGVTVLGRRRQPGGWWGWLLVLLAFLTICGAEAAGGGRQVGAACALTITPCAARWSTTEQRAGLSAVCELAEWRSQASELAESCAEVASERAESATAAAGCRRLEAGCRTVPAQAG